MPGSPTQRTLISGALVPALALLLVACPVTRVNQVPVAHDLAITAVEDVAVGITLDASDPDDDPITWTITRDPDHGTLTGAAPDLTYTPDRDYAGPDGFTYAARDGEATSAEATVTITVSARNDPPVALDQDVATSEDTPVVVILTATDVDGDRLTFAIVQEPEHGSWSGVPPEVTYVPAKDDTGSDTFTFTAADGETTSAEATVTIEVSGTNDPPARLTLDGATVDEEQPAGVEVGTFATDDPDQAGGHTYTLVPGTGDDDNARFAIVGDVLRTATTLDYEATPTLSIRVRTTDAFAAHLDAAFTIAVGDVNEAPTDVTFAPASILENEPAGSLVGVLTASDPDLGDTHTYALVDGEGDDDNHRFLVTGGELRSAEPFDHEATPTLGIRIRAQDLGGLGVERALNVAVMDVEEASVTSVTIDQNDQELEIGDAVHLTATVATTGGADASVDWSSGDEAIATVDPTGTVTGVSVGRTSVTATSVFDRTRTDSIVVEVVPSSDIPVTGPEAPGMEHYDDLVTELMREHQIPGGAVAVVKDGRLVFAHGYGWADVEHGVPVQPDALFRVASLAKPITSVAVLALVEDGQLALADAAFAYLADLEPPVGAVEDPRLGDVTIQDLLHHSGGWDRFQTFDPMFRSTFIASALGEAPPSSCEMVIRYMRGQPLQFDPGTRHAYSNYGYCVLGRIIESVTGATYATWVETHVLEPAGANDMFVGRTRFEDRDAGEVLYYAVPGEPIDDRLVTSVFPEDGRVPEPYGGFYLEAADAPSGWVSSTIDFLRFLGAVDGRSDRPDILSRATIDQMIARPPDENETWRDATSWYAMGWSVQPASEDATWWHVGSLPGCRTVAVRAYDGVSWAAFFNARSPGTSFGAELDAALGSARHQVTTWPDTDLFPQYP